MTVNNVKCNNSLNEYLPPLLNVLHVEEMSIYLSY